MDEKKLNQAKLGAIITAEDTRLVEELIGIDENGKIDLAKLEQRLPDLKRILASAIAERKLLKHPMPEQDPEVRSHNFDEVALGYSPEVAIAEAKRCLNCKNPMCRNGCPVSVRIPEFIAKVAEGDFDAAYEIITSTNALPAVCGRVCPQERQCESRCVRGVKGESVAIGRLERFVADYHMAKKNKAPVTVPESNGHRIAVIGSGPAGLTCAGDLRKMGYTASPSSVCPRRSWPRRSRI